MKYKEFHRKILASGWNIMKYKEFHRKILASGWKFSHAEGSHYFYLKDGRLSEPVPYHGAKEIPEPLRRKIAKGMGVK